MRRLRVIAALVLTVVSSLGPARAQLEEQWNATYNTVLPGTGFRGAIASDGEGNVQVAGWVCGDDCDLMTVRYDPQGRTLWTAHFPTTEFSPFPVCLALGPSGSSLVGGARSLVRYAAGGQELWRLELDQYVGVRAVAMDGQGNAYVAAGHIFGDYVTTKFDPAGELLWSASLDTGLDDEIRALAVDGEGNVAVTGKANFSCFEGCFGGDLGTVKYDAGGNELWRAIVDGEAMGMDEAHALALGPDGSVFVTGTVKSRNAGDDWLTLKYDPQGNEVWRQVLDGVLSGDDSARSVALDGEGNVLVAGASTTFAGSTTTTAKYDPTGKELWRAVHREPDDGSQTGIAAALDAGDNVYVACALAGGIAIVKYDPDGRRSWSVRRMGRTAAGLALDPAGRAFAVDTEQRVHGFDAGGGDLWTARTEVPISWDDQANSLALDPEGQVHVTGRGGDDLVTIRYDADGNQLWVARFDGDSPDLLDLPFAVAADVGGTYVAASSFITHEDSQYVTLKYDAAGSLLWQVALNAAPGMQDEPRAMVLDRAGNVYMTGRSEDPLNREQFVTVKYDAHGKEVWSQAIIGGSPFDLAVTGDGAVTVAGNHGPLGSPSYAVARYDGEGRQEWFLRYPGSAAAMAVDEEGGAYLTGNSSSPNSQGGIDRYIATLKYSARGDLVWEARREEGGAVRLALDGNGSLYVLGYAQTGTQPGTFESFILKYDVAGRFQWSKRYRERGFERTIATRIAARGGRVYLAGSVGDDLSYPGILAAVFDGDGNFQGSGSHLGADGLGASAATFAVDGAGGVVIAGFVGRRPASSDLIVLKYEPRAEPSFRRGDTNGDGAFDLSDPVLVLLHLFLGMTPPACMKSADVDDSSRLDVTDAIQALNFLFLGGPPPAPPYPDCGDDPTRDGLGCQAYAPCS